MAELESTRDVDLGFYTLFCWVNCCCLGGIIGFFLCLYCRSRIRHFCDTGNLGMVEKWQKRFWICFFLNVVLQVIIVIIGLITQVFSSIMAAFS